ncbi:MAG: hypothetical protein IH972_04065 [Candidatus Marinimicrobia bacterium]|nr:hypothetical protein [Candidatus Neomarinimicrobiota bacterium]
MHNITRTQQHTSGQSLWLRVRDRTLACLLAGFMLAGCAQELVNIGLSDVQNLAPGDLERVQFFSGPVAIVFQADTMEITVETFDEEMPPGIVVTEHQFVIPANTAGRASHFDPLTEDLFILYDENLPALSYRDNGRGLALTTLAINIDDVSYLRIMRFDNRDIATADWTMPLFLKVMEANLTRVRVEDRKASGLPSLD